MMVLDTPSRSGLAVGTTYVLIDLENVQPSSLSSLDLESTSILVFVGANQKSLSFECVAALQKFGERGQYVRISGNGPNALDFHIAFYIGRLSAQEPDAQFCIISNDAGFDPLIHHLHGLGIRATRVKALKSLPGSQTHENGKSNKISSTNGKSHSDSAPPAPEKADLNALHATVLTQLHRLGNSKPSRLKSLRNTIRALSLEKATPTELETILKRLEAEGVIEQVKNRLVYHLPAPKPTT